MDARILILDNNCLNALQSRKASERLRANLKATGRVLWPTGLNALEAAQTSDRPKRIRLLRTLAELAGDNVAFPMPEEALQRVAEAIAGRSKMIKWVDGRLTRLFREPESISDEEVGSIRDHLRIQEANFDQMHMDARKTLAREFKTAGGYHRWKTASEYLRDFWTDSEHLAAFITPLWEGWGLPGPAPVDALLRQDAWRLFFDGWGAAAYARLIAHPQRGRVQSADLKQLVYLAAAPDRILVTEDAEFRALANSFLRERYRLAIVVPLADVVT